MGKPLATLNDDKSPAGLGQKSGDRPGSQRAFGPAHRYMPTSTPEISHGCGCEPQMPASHTGTGPEICLEREY